MTLPTYNQSEQLHHKYAPSKEAFDLVFTHCRIVRDIADQLMASMPLDVDAELVRVGCLLHDIGVYALGKDSHYITHGIRGEEILKAEGLPKEIWRIASHHTGVGLTKQDIMTGQLPLPPQDFMAETTEELLVMYADKFHSKTEPPYFNQYDWYKDYVVQFGADKVEKFQAMANQFGVPNLPPIVAQYGHQLRPETTN